MWGHSRRSPLRFQSVTCSSVERRVLWEDCTSRKPQCQIWYLISVYYSCKNRGGIRVQPRYIGNASDFEFVSDIISTEDGERVSLFVETRFFRLEAYLETARFVRLEDPSRLQRLLQDHLWTGDALRVFPFGRPLYPRPILRFARRYLLFRFTRRSSSPPFAIPLIFYATLSQARLVGLHRFADRQGFRYRCQRDQSIYVCVRRYRI